MIAASEIERLRGRRANGSDGPVELPTMLALGQIAVRQAAFQHRASEDARSHLHIEELVGGIHASGKLDPVTVWWDGFGWVCIDGHHRLAAYRKAGWDDYAQVPVAVFDGTPDEAVREALRGNSKAKLPMTQEERSDAAWSLVGTGPDAHTAAQIAEAASIHIRTVRRMRTVYRKLIDELGVKPAAVERMSWSQARLAARGGNVNLDEEWDQEAEAKALADRLTATFGKHRLTEKLDVLVQALHIYDRRMPWVLVEVMREEGYLDDEDRDWEEEEEAAGGDL